MMQWIDFMEAMYRKPNDILNILHKLLIEQHCDYNVKELEQLIWHKTRIWDSSWQKIYYKNSDQW